jgi:ComF family protein
VSNWIQSLKYGGRDVLVRLLARLMHDAPCGEAPLADGGWVIPVPLHRRRLRQRGFNQSYLLAHAWRAAWRETGNARPALRSRLLARQRYTRPQVELTSDAREANVAGAFLVRMPLAGRRVLLVDDVLTTGSTLRACAEALRAAGAARVEAFAVARA